MQAKPMTSENVQHPFRHGDAGATGAGAVTDAQLAEPYSGALGSSVQGK